MFLSAKGIWSRRVSSRKLEGKNILEKEFFISESATELNIAPNNLLIQKC